MPVQAATPPPDRIRGRAAATRVGARRWRTHGAHSETAERWVLVRARSGPRGRRAARAARLGANTLDAVSAATGERDPEKLLDMVKAALTLPMPAVDMGGDPEMATVLAKAVTARPSVSSSAVLGLGLAEVEAAERLQHAEHLREHLGDRSGVPDGKLRELRSDVDAVRFAKTLQPMRRGFPAAGPWEDNRNELRARRDEMRRLGHGDVAEALQRELDFAEARAATQTPSATIGWGGAARRLPAA